MLVLSKVNFLNRHECNWKSMFNVGVIAEPLAFGVRCEDYDDPDGSDGIGFGLGGGDGRTVTDLILPRETCSIVLQMRRRFPCSYFYVLRRIDVENNVGQKQ